MSTHDDYLLDPRATPDPEVQALERALAPLRWREVPLREAEPLRPMKKPRRLWPWLLAAALLAVTVSLVATWGDRGLHPDAAARSFVAKASELRIPLGELAEITLRPGSELQFVHWREKKEALFALTRGSLEAKVVAPPVVPVGFFCVDTPRGRVIDQGCRYELELRDDGQVHVRVIEGAVTFAAAARTAFVPAGAEVDVTAAGPQIPLFKDVQPELMKAVREYEAALTPKSTFDMRGMSVKLVLAAAQSPRDSLALWHMLSDPEPAFCEQVEAHLLQLVGSPDGGKSKGQTFDPAEWLPYLRLSAWQQ
ncbi:MAG TPA: FecR domain-containing protein [Planctomycetota bacterium]|nr:FecR domain-containing protein [Planctomycetota bacterium]